MAKTTEDRGVYNVKRDGLLSKTALKRRESMLRYSNPRYRDPTPDDVESLLHICGWSQSEVAERLGITSTPGQGSSTVRKWKTPTSEPNYRQIPYAAWRLWLLESELVKL